MTRTNFQYNATELDKDGGGSMCLCPRPHSPLLATELRGAALSSARPGRQRQSMGCPFRLPPSSGCTRAARVQLRTGSGPDHKDPQKLLKGCLVAVPQMAQGQETVGPSPKKEQGRASSLAWRSRRRGLGSAYLRARLRRPRDSDP